MAVKFDADLRARMKNIAKSGVMGVSREWMFPGLRMHIHKKRCIYFVFDDNVVHVTRILHGSQDRQSELRSELR